MKMEKKRKELVDYWNHNVLCNMPSKKEIRRSRKRLKRLKQQMLKDFDDYMNVISV
jgi:hypothetical protein